MAAEEKVRYRNTTKGHIGAVILNEENRRQGVAVPPGDTIELSEVEVRMTKNAPKNPDNNPFVGNPPQLELAPDDRPDRPEPEPERDAEAEAEKKPRPKGRRQSEETGAAQEPAGDAPEGGYASGEEVATPDAAEKAA